MSLQICRSGRKRPFVELFQVSIEAIKINFTGKAKFNLRKTACQWADMGWKLVTLPTLW